MISALEFALEFALEIEEGSAEEGSAEEGSLVEFCRFERRVDERDVWRAYAVGYDNVGTCFRRRL